MKKVSFNLKDLAHKIQAEIIGDFEHVISSIAPIQSAKKDQLSFVHNPKYRPHLKTTEAGAILLTRDLAKECCTNALIVDDPYFAYAVIAREFEEQQSLPTGIHATAVIGQRCQIPASVAIGPYVVIGDDVVIGERTQIHAGTVIGSKTQIGEDGLLWSNVTVYPNMQIGHRVILHSSCVIGADGFGLAKHNGRWHRIPQLGRVVLGDDVEVGASTTIDRGALEDTVIEDGVKMDNQIQIGHNARIGAHTIMAGGSGVSGSTTIGKHCMFGAEAGVGGHLTIADHVVLGGRSMITKSITEPGVYTSGTGFFPLQKWKKIIARFRHLDDLADRLIKLEKKVNE